MTPRGEDKAGNTRSSAPRDAFPSRVGSGAELKTGGRLQGALGKLSLKSPVTCLVRDPFCHVILLAAQLKGRLRGVGGLLINKSLSSCHHWGVHLVI